MNKSKISAAMGRKNESFFLNALTFTGLLEKNR